MDETGGRARSAIGRVRAAARAHVWQLLPGGLPEVRFAGGMCQPGMVVLRIDGTIVVAHSKKERGAPAFKKTFGHHPLGCWIDNTGELAALLLRAGNAGSNIAADLTAVLHEAITQIPKQQRRRLLITCDGAGASHGLIDWAQRQNHAADRTVEYSVGFDVDADVRAAIGRLPADRWAPGLDATTGNPRADIDVAEITDLLRERLTRTGWPKNMRVIVRRTRLAPGEQPTLFQLDGYKHSCFVTNTGPGLSGQLLDARHRAHARVEDGVRTGKDTGLGHLPSKSWTVNLAWCHAVTIAVDLLAWLKLLGCPDIDTLNRAEPATLRYRLLHVPARLVRRARIRWLRVPRTWPWATALAQAFDRIRALRQAQPD